MNWVKRNLIFVIYSAAAALLLFMTVIFLAVASVAYVFGTDGGAYILTAAIPFTAATCAMMSAFSEVRTYLLRIQEKARNEQK